MCITKQITKILNTFDKKITNCPTILTTIFSYALYTGKNQTSERNAIISTTPEHSKSTYMEMLLPLEVIKIMLFS
jgi:hypothetical protein